VYLALAARICKNKGAVGWFAGWRWCLCNENTLGRCNVARFAATAAGVWLHCPLWDSGARFGKLSQTIIIPVNTNSHNEDSMFGGRFPHQQHKQEKYILQTRSFSPREIYKMQRCRSRRQEMINYSAKCVKLEA
jgi:hypothetical protein